jgi:hypothetical protein
LSSNLEEQQLTEEELSIIELALSEIIGDYDANKLLTKITSVMNRADYYKTMYDRTKDRLRRAREVIGVR